MTAWLLSRVVLPLKGYLIAGLAILAVAGTIFTKGLLKGRAMERKAQTEAVKKVERRWNETDRLPLDFDGAVERLRKRSRSGR